MINENKVKPQAAYLQSIGKRYEDMTKEESSMYHSIGHKYRYELKNKDLLTPAPVVEEVIADGPLERGYHRYPKGITDKERRQMYHARKQKCVYHRLNRWFRSARQRSGHTKADSFEELVGLPSTVELREYIESQFTEGMCWNNWGKGKGRTVWHIDHIVAIKDGGSHHHSNLQPLWHIDNLRK